MHLKLANLDFKFKQLQLDDKRESHALKKKYTLVEEELLKLKKENEQLIAQRQEEEENNEKNLKSVKQKAELKMASLKKQFENDASTKVDELSARNGELEKQLSEQLKLVEKLQTAEKESDFEKQLADLSKRSAERESSLSQEISELKATLAELTNIIKEHETESRSYREELDLLRSLNDESNSDRVLIDGLKRENRELIKSLDDLKYSYDELNDEKQQLYKKLNSSQSNQNQQLKARIEELEQKLMDMHSKDVDRYYKNVTLNDTSSMICLEATEIDYLRQIVSAYMMGTDPIVNSFFFLHSFHFYF